MNFNFSFLNLARYLTVILLSDRSAVWDGGGRGGRGMEGYRNLLESHNNSKTADQYDNEYLHYGIEST